MTSWLDIDNSLPLISNEGRLELANTQTDLDADIPSEGFALLDSQAILAIEGEDAIKFLQGQCTADLESINDEESTEGAICSVKGRVICNFRVYKKGDLLLLRMASDLVEKTAEHLKKFAVFFKAEISVWNTPCVAFSFGPEAKVDDSSEIYTMKSNVGFEYYTEPNAAKNLLDQLNNAGPLKSESDWYRARLASGLTNINSCNSEQYLPHQLNLDKTGAVSFTKGCYTGQEIVARMEYRGKTKRRAQAVFFQNKIPASHELKIQLDDERKSDVEIVEGVWRKDDALLMLVLPVDQVRQGKLFMNDELEEYEILDLPYQIKENE